MLDRELRLFAMVLDYARKLVRDLDDAHLADQPAEGVNHPAWVLGHLTVVSDMGTKLLGGESVLPEDWKIRFGPGSKTSSDRSEYPSKEELLAHFETCAANFVEAAGKVGERRLGLPNPTPFFVAQLPTVADLAAHLMTTHPMLHLGQLSTWRRVNGLPSVLAI